MKSLYQIFFLLMVFLLIGCTPSASETEEANTPTITKTLPVSTSTNAPGITQEPSRSATATKVDIRVTPTVIATQRHDYDFSDQSIQLVYLYDISQEMQSITAEDPYPALITAVEEMNDFDSLYGAEIRLTAIEISEGGINGKAEMMDLLEENPASLVILPEELPDSDFTQYLTANQIPSLILQPRSTIPEGFVGLNPSLDILFEAALIGLEDNWDEIAFYRHAEGINFSFLSWKMYEGRKPIIPQPVLDILSDGGINMVLRDGIYPQELAVTADVILQSQTLGANVIIINNAGFGLANLLNDLNNTGLRQDYLVIALQAGRKADFEHYLANEDYLENLFFLSSFAWQKDMALDRILSYQIENFLTDFWIRTFLLEQEQASISLYEALTEFKNESLHIDYAQSPYPDKIFLYQWLERTAVLLDEIPAP